MDAIQPSKPANFTPETDHAGSQSAQSKKNRKTYSIIAVILFILIAGELGFVLFHNSSFFTTLQSTIIPHKDTTNNNSTNKVVITQKLLPDKTKNIIVPIPTGEQSVNGIGKAAGFIIHLNKVIENPTTVRGDKPLNGLKYIVFEVSVTNNTDTTAIIPGMFYFQDAATGKLFMPANTFGYVPAYNWIVSTFSQKHVMISGKSSLMTTEIPAGQTVNNLFLIYQMLPLEKGQLVWNTEDSITEIKFGQTGSRTKVIFYDSQNKIFELNTTNNKDNRIKIFSLP